MKRASTYLLFYFLLNAFLLSTGGVDSNDELFQDLKIALVTDAQSNSFENSLADSDDDDFSSLILFITPLLTNELGYLTHQFRLANFSNPRNSIRSPPQ